VISLLDAAHYHPDVSQRPYSPMKVYYYVKNSIILNSKYFNYVWLRNVLTVIAVLARTSKRNGFFVMLSYVMGKNSPIFWRAIVRGLRGVIAKDFNG
jgi:rhamnopyranosyl-N-acetylglucosaminyl-diphospho-decaprenol beta-1,3/1,4-galactofuranosyltransferase